MELCNTAGDRADDSADEGEGNMIAHCLFEQSGTFKNEFKKLGIEAYDYDILNDFKQTDYQIDLFAEIEKAYGGGTSIFDKMTPDDVILAFFPCTRFENQIMLSFRGQSKQFKTWTMQNKIRYDMDLMDELRLNYMTVSKMFIVCLDRGLKLIMENPYSEEHFLRRYWCYPATIIDKDRRDRGDYYKKPTQYWFLNCKPQNNFLFEATEWNAIDCKDANRRMKAEHYRDYANNMKEARSMIHPSYAQRFIREQLLKEET
jgi:hypothetical protein